MPYKPNLIILLIKLPLLLVLICLVFCFESQAFLQRGRHNSLALTREIWRGEEIFKGARQKNARGKPELPIFSKFCTWQTLVM